jgi:hypothetical protein
MNGLGTTIDPPIGSVEIAAHEDAGEIPSVVDSQSQIEQVLDLDEPAAPILPSSSLMSLADRMAAQIASLTADGDDDDSDNSVDQESGRDHAPSPVVSPPPDTESRRVVVPARTNSTFSSGSIRVPLPVPGAPQKSADGRISSMMIARVPVPSERQPDRRRDPSIPPGIPLAKPTARTSSVVVPPFVAMLAQQAAESSKDSIPVNTDIELQEETSQVIELDDAATWSEAADDRSTLTSTRPPVVPPPRPSSPPPVPGKRTSTPSVVMSSDAQSPVTQSVNHKERTSEQPHSQQPDVVDNSDDFVSIDSAVELLPIDADGLLDAALDPETLMQLQTPSVADAAIDELSEAGLEAKALRDEHRLAQLELLQTDDGNRQAAALAYELGQWYETTLVDQARAAKAYGRALQLQPSLRANLWAIRGVFYRRQLWPNLLNLIEAELTFASTDRERSDLYLERADVLQRTVDQDGDAIDAYEMALRFDPESLSAFLGLERMLGKRFDPNCAAQSLRLADVAQRIAQQQSTPQRSQTAWLRVAELSAPFDWLRTAQALDKADELTTSAGGGMWLAERKLQLIARHRYEDESEYVDALVHCAHATSVHNGLPISGESLDPWTNDENAPTVMAVRLRVALLYRRAALLVQKTDLNRAWNLLQTGLRFCSGETLLWSDQAALAVRLGKFREVADMLGEAQQAESDPARQLSYAVRRADALLRDATDEGRIQAEQAVSSLLTMDGGSVLAISAAERLALHQGDVQQLAAAWQMMGDSFGLGTWHADTSISTASARRPDAAAIWYLVAAQLRWTHGDANRGGADAIRSLLSKAREASKHEVIARSAWQASLDFEMQSGATLEGQLQAALALLGFEHSAVSGSLSEIACGAPWTQQERYARAYMLTVSQYDLFAALGIAALQISSTEQVDSAIWRHDALAVVLGKDIERHDQLVALTASAAPNDETTVALVELAWLCERASRRIPSQRVHWLNKACVAYREVLKRWPDDSSSLAGLLSLLRQQQAHAEMAALRLWQAEQLPDGSACDAAFAEALLCAEQADHERLAAAPLDSTTSQLTAAAIASKWVARSPYNAAALLSYAQHNGPPESENRVGQQSAFWRTAQTAWRAVFEDMTADATATAKVAALAIHADACERSGAVGALNAYNELRFVAQGSDALWSHLAAADLQTDQIELAVIDETIAAAVGHSSIAAEIYEHRGWLSMLAPQADNHAAEQSFLQATVAAPSAMGPMHGLALLAARQRDQRLHSRWYRSLAATCTTPTVQASLLLRAAVGEWTIGDADSARQAVTQAATLGVDGLATILAAQWQGLIASNESAVARDELVDASALYAQAAKSSNSEAENQHWLLEQVDALARSERWHDAAVILAPLLKQTAPSLRCVWLGLQIAIGQGHAQATADGWFALGKRLHVVENQLAAYRNAVVYYDGQGPERNVDAAIISYWRILQLDSAAPEFTALVRLLTGDDHARLLDAVIAARIERRAFDHGNAAEIAALWFQRAKLASTLDGVADDLHNVTREITALEQVLALTPMHVEACWRRGQLALANHDVTMAIALWQRCASATHGAARVHYEMHLADLFEDRVSDAASAMQCLQSVLKVNRQDVDVRKRLLNLALQAQHWAIAVEQLRELASLRASNVERARDQLRIGQILRDHLADKAGARMALDAARRMDPLNLDVVRDLAELLDAQSKSQLLEIAAQDLRADIAVNPGAADLYERLAMIHGWQRHVDARWLALTSLERLRTPSPDQVLVIATGRSAAPAIDWSALPARWSSSIADACRLESASKSLGDNLGTLRELCEVIAPVVATIIGQDPSSLGFVRGDRIAQKKIADKYPAVAALLTSFGINDVDIFVSATMPSSAYGVMLEQPSLCIGVEVAKANNREQRFELAHTVALLSQKVGIFAKLGPQECLSYIVAAMRAAELPIPVELSSLSMTEVQLNERSKLMRKWSRKDKSLFIAIATKATVEYTEAFCRELIDGVNCFGHRAGLLLSGDIQVALGALDIATPVHLDRRGADLLVWNVSEEHHSARKLLKLVPGGTP